jgi:hypothetical protein
MRIATMTTTCKKHSMPRWREWPNRLGNPCRNWHLAQHAHVKLPGHHISKEATHPFPTEVREQEIRQLLLEHKKTLNEALNQTLELETANTAAKTPHGVWQLMTRTFRKSPMERRDDQHLTCWHCRSTSHFQKFCPHKLEEMATCL